MNILRNKKTQRKKKNGFTLAELLVAIAVLAFGVTGTLLFFSNAMAAREYAEDLTIASTHAEFILEEIVTKSALADITAADWTAWAVSTGLNTLPTESCSVTYPAGTSADPLEIQVTVNWVRKGRTNSTSLTTQITK